MRTYQTSLAGAGSLKDDRAAHRGKIPFDILCDISHIFFAAQLKMSQRTFSPFCPWKTNTKHHQVILVQKLMPS